MDDDEQEYSRLKPHIKRYLKQCYAHLGDMHAKYAAETGAQQNKVEKTMHEFKEGDLHSGSKHGPEVTNHAQAVAIAMHQAGLSKK